MAGNKRSRIVKCESLLFWGNCESVWQSESQNCKSCTFS